VKSGRHVKEREWMGEWSPHLPSQLVDQHLQSIPVRVRREVDRRPETAPILGRLELDDNGGYGCFLRCGRARLEGLGVGGLLPLGRGEEGGHDEAGVRTDRWDERRE
jgi:hypothetical protein